MLPLNKVILEDLDAICRSGIDWSKLKNSRVLVTGANGLIASYIIYTLLHLNETQGCGITIYALARSEEKIRRRYGALLERADFKLVLQDVTAPLLLDLSMDYIIHAASQTSPKQFTEDPVGTALGNVLGTNNMLSFAVKSGAKVFLLLSTREIYGKSVKEFAEEDDYGVTDPTQVRSCYPEGKRMAETLCAAYREQHELNCKIARIAHAYGPGMLLSDGRVVGDFIGNVVRKEPIVMNSDGSGTLALTYISDLVSGLFMTICNFDEFVYNISDSSHPITVRQLAELLCETASDPRIRLEIHLANQRQSAGYLAHKVPFLSATKANVQGWLPRVSLQNGLRKTVAFFVQQI